MWGTLYADDAGIVSRSPRGLETRTTGIVTGMLGVRAYGVRGTNGDHGPVNKMGEEDVVRIRCSRPGIYTNNGICALGRGYQRMQRLSVEIARLLQRAWACFQRCKTEIYDHPGVRSRLKARMLEAKEIETTLRMRGVDPE